MIIKALLLSSVLVISTASQVYAPRIEPMPAICSSTEELFKGIINKKNMKAIIMNYDEDNDLLHVIFANSNREIIVTVSSPKENKSCVLSIFDGASGLFDFNQLKKNEKI